ncbi:hypothetical protein F5Y01DRAFT_314955 [Xylaria sp. FL0043]|nr:hypothetical protein F5Y01DRAFT_314955 [Xylaria sp. FL0043]
MPPPAYGSSSTNFPNRILDHFYSPAPGAGNTSQEAHVDNNQRNYHNNGTSDGHDNAHEADRDEGGHIHNPEEGRNSSLYIPFLRPDVTYNALLKSIRGIGRIRYIRIRTPTLDRPYYCRAVVTFFSHDAARRLCTLSKQGRFEVLGIVTLALWTDPAVPEVPAHGRSRVLIIQGPTEIANQFNLFRIWQQTKPPGHSYHVEFIAENTLDDLGSTQVWCFFACWERQAEAARAMLLNRYGDRILVNYGHDPCGD